MVETMALGGLSFELNDEQKMLQKMARDFAAEEIIPVADHYDRSAEFPMPVIQKARQAGFVGVNVPDQYGGAGASVLEECVVMEELAYGCSGISTAIGVSNLALLPIRFAGSEAQKEHWLGDLAMDKGQLASYCVTEPDAGSDVASMRTRAERRNGSYIINGAKMFISNANFSSFFTVFAVTDPEKRHKGISCFIVEKDRPGVSVSRHFDKLGQRAADTAEITFENVEVPEANRLGDEGTGFYL